MMKKRKAEGKQKNQIGNSIEILGGERVGVGDGRSIRGLWVKVIG